MVLNILSRLFYNYSDSNRLRNSLPVMTWLQRPPHCTIPYRFSLASWSWKTCWTTRGFKFTFSRKDQTNFYLLNANILHWNCNFHFDGLYCLWIFADFYSMLRKVINMMCLSYEILILIKISFTKTKENIRDIWRPPSLSELTPY